MSNLFDAELYPTPRQAGRYRTIAADPPWPEHGGGKVKRGADRHYPLMSVEAIASMPVQTWSARDSHLYLWVTNNFLEGGLHVLRAWGYRYVTKIDWTKVDAGGRIQKGLGQYFQGATESCLFGVRGQCPYRTDAAGRRARGCTALLSPRTAHSEKPDAMRQQIELVSYGPYLELFARRSAPGWDAWGNQAPVDEERLRA